MKRTITAILCIVMLLFCGCGRQEAIPAPAPTEAPEATEAPKPVETPAPTEELTVKTETGYTRLFSTPAILTYLDRGTQGEIIGEQDNYYLFKTEEYCGYVEKGLLYTENDKPFEPFNLFLNQGVKVYPNYHLYGEELMTIETPVNVPVLADLEDCFEVEVDGVVGFVDASVRVKYFYYDGFSGGGGGYDNDGQDIPVKANGNDGARLMKLAYVAPKSGESMGRAETKVDCTELILALYELGEEIAVINEKDGVCRVSVDGIETEMPRRFVRMEDEKPYESWEGYAAAGAKLFNSIYLLGAHTSLPVNEELTVLDEFDTCYLVKVNRTGEMGYVALDCVGKELHVLYDYAGGGGGGGGGPEWTDPLL